MGSGVVGDDSESADRISQDSAVKVGNDVGATTVAGYDDVWAEVARAHFPVQRFFNFRISDED